MLGALVLQKLGTLIYPEYKYIKLKKYCATEYSSDFYSKKIIQLISNTNIFNLLQHSRKFHNFSLTFREDYNRFFPLSLSFKDN